MSFQGISQIVVYAVALLALGYPLGLYMARVYGGLGAPPVLRQIERGFYRLVRTDPTREQDWKSYGKTVVIFSILFSGLLYAILRLQGHLFLNPDKLAGRAVAHLAQHDGELRHEHQLAVLRRRVHDVVPVADGRPRGAELRLGRGGHGRSRRRRARACASHPQRARELLGRPLPLDRLHPPAPRADPRE